MHSAIIIATRFMKVETATRFARQGSRIICETVFQARIRPSSFSAKFLSLSLSVSFGTVCSFPILEINTRIRLNGWKARSRVSILCSILERCVEYRRLQARARVCSESFNNRITHRSIGERFVTGRGKLARFDLIGGRPANLLCNFFSPDRTKHA